ncbi:MAG: alanyl-tRNA editing protein [Lachnospirales bacterium]
METKKLYYENPYEKNFEAEILNIEVKENHIEIILDKTLFYPLGGGQPADKGSIMGFEVYDVRNKNEVITHYLKEFNNHKVGDKVNGEIDWKVRFENMQCHTAEHLVTGVARKLYSCDNVGFNISENLVTIDLNVELNYEQVQELEILVNEQIQSATKVDITYPSSSELQALEYRSKLDLYENVRIVTLDGIDICACCGLHCYNTLEIGLIKFISWKKHKSGIRIMCLAGYRAIYDYITKHKYIMNLSEVLSAKEEEIVDRVKKLNDEFKESKHKEKLIKEELLRYKLKDCNEHIFCEDDLEFVDLKFICNEILKSKDTAFAVSLCNNEVRYLLSSKTIDVTLISKELNAAFNGKGGGSKSMVQGTVFCDIQVAINFLKEIDN